MAVTHGYITVDELRDLLRDQLTAYDAEYERAIAAASRSIDDYCGRRFWKDTVPTARLFRPDRHDLVWCGDIASTTGLVVATDDDGDGVFETTWTLDTDFILEPFERMNDRPYERIAAVDGNVFPSYSRNTGYFRGSSYYQPNSSMTNRRPRVSITATWGWPDIPPEVKSATAIVATDHFRAKDLMHVASTYGNDVRVARDQTPGLFGRKTRFSRLRAPSLNPEAESLIASLRTTVIA